MFSTVHKSGGMRNAGEVPIAGTTKTSKVGFLELS